MDGLDGEIVIARIALVGLQRFAEVAVVVGPGAHGGLVVHGAGLDDGNVQELGKLGVPDTERDVEVVLVVTRALVAGKAAPEAVLGRHRALEGVADVLSGDGGAVVEDVARIDGESPVSGGVVGKARVQHVGDNLKIVVQLHHVLIHQIAEKLV